MKENIMKILKNLKYVIVELDKRYAVHSISAYSAQTAFFLVLAIFPFFIFLFTVLGRFSIDSDMLLNVLEAFFPKEVHILILDFIKSYIVIEGNSVISASILGTIWSSSKGVRALSVSLNKAYDITETRNFFIVKLLDMVYTIIIVIGIVVLLALPNIGLEFYLFITKYINVEWELFEKYNQFKMLTMPFAMVLVMTLTYKFMPNVKLKFKEVLYGTVFAILGWTALSYVFSIFLNNFADYKVVYGSLATVIILMLWLYLSSIILIVGGEINSIIKTKNKKDL